MAKDIRFVQGNVACAEGALYAGLEFFAGYPITPSTEVAEYLAEALPRSGGSFIQMEDEIASMCAIVGASLAGVKSLTATSGPGFSLMQEALGYACMAEAPCVVCSVMRGGPSTGLPTKVAQGDVNQARWGAHGDHSIIVLTASSVQDVFTMTVEAFNLAETYRTPVILLLDEVIGHMREKLVIPARGEVAVARRVRSDVPPGGIYHPYLAHEDGSLPMADLDGPHRYNVTGLFHDIWGFPSEKPEVVDKLLRHLCDKIDAHSTEIARYKEYYLDDAQTLFISYGSAARTALHQVAAMRARGVKAGLLELQTIWPFPKDIVREHAARCKNVYVVEMNMGQVCAAVKGAVDAPGHVYLVNRVDGEMVKPRDIETVLRIVEGV